MSKNIFIPYKSMLFLWEEPRALQFNDFLEVGQVKEKSDTFLQLHHQCVTNVK